MLTHFSLCSGIGGLDLAAEWAGFCTVAQCEIDGYASRVLAKNFPGVHNFGDIRTVTNESARAAGIAVEKITVLSAGFPCQPYSLAGKGLGDGDERDLWGEVARIIHVLGPRWFVGENTPGLFARAGQKYFTRILADLVSLGYCVSWGIWGACDVGAAHKRNRVFLVAHTDGERRRSVAKVSQNRRVPLGISALPFGSVWEKETRKTAELLLCLHRSLPEPSGGFLRNDNGVPEALDRIKCLGNAVVPQQAFPIFKAIADYENEKGVK